MIKRPPKPPSLKVNVNRYFSTLIEASMWYVGPQKLSNGPLLAHWKLTKYQIKKEHLGSAKIEAKNSPELTPGHQYYLGPVNIRQKFRTLKGKILYVQLNLALGVTRIFRVRLKNFPQEIEPPS